MRVIAPAALNAGRVRKGPYATDDNDGPQGKFFVLGPLGETLKIIASAGLTRVEHGWEHVSVSREARCPTWEEMAFVKYLFWRPEETVVQFHPAAAHYVNHHPFCLHLWRDRNRGHKLPPAQLVGPRDQARSAAGAAG